MKKIILALTLAFISSLGLAQNDFPTKAECEKYIQSTSKLQKEVEEMLGMAWSKLKVESDNWKGYKGSVFSLSLSDCGKSLRASGTAWPEDAAYAKWVVTTPKNSDGIYKQMGIYMDYKRTTYDGEYCRLGDWFFNGYRLESASEYGHKEFTKQEISDIFFKEFKSGKIHALNDFVELEEISGDNAFSQNSPQPGMRYLYIYFSGTEVNAASDNSVIFCSDKSSHKLTLSITKEGGNWVVVNSLIDNRDPSEEAMPLGQYCYMSPGETVENYETYETAGWEAIYMTKTKRSTEGKYGKLMSRMEELNSLLKNKGMDIEKEDLIPFIQPSQIAGLDDASLSISTSNVPYVLPFHSVKGKKSLLLTDVKFGGATFMSAEKDGAIVEFAFPNIEMKFNRMLSKGKKWAPIGGNTVTNRAQSKPSASHNQAWVYLDGQWFLYDVASAFCGSQEGSKEIDAILEGPKESGGGFTY